MLLAVTLFISIVCGSLLHWYEDTFNVSVAEILFTVQGPLAGADSHFMQSTLPYVIPAVMAFFLVFFLLLKLISTYKKALSTSSRDKSRCLGSALKLIFVVSCSAAFFTLAEADHVLKVSSFIIHKLDTTTIYEDYYIEPESSKITSDNPRNLIYIVMESMETTYASEKYGGHQKENNYIPNLTQMADENISFSNSSMLGGFRSLTGTTWTMGSLFSTESGIPFAFPIDGNEMGNKMTEFAGGTTTLGDILQEKGYYQEFLCGSDGDFAGRKMFFKQHGYDRVYDLYSAIDDGYVRKANAWWGLEDRKLYKIAKKELTRISKKDKPFNLTLLTVDTHHVDGWVCRYCHDTYPDQLANVVVCADNQIYYFIEWCRQQPWYENTTIIIQGDHPRMDNSLVDGVDYLDRTIYNCFINSPYDKSSLKTKRREFASFDMFPSILSSIGFSVPGNRLGLGTNMFSSRKTLSEQIGYEKLDKELKKGSSYYKRFY